MNKPELEALLEELDSVVCFTLQEQVFYFCYTGLSVR
jgi:hypothetical protein